MTPLKKNGFKRPDDEGKPAYWCVYHGYMRWKERAGKTAGVGVALARPDETMVETVELERGGADQREERGADAHEDERGAAEQERERGAADREQHDHQRHDEDIDETGRDGQQEGRGSSKGVRPLCFLGVGADAALKVLWCLMKALALYHRIAIQIGL